MSTQRQSLRQICRVNPEELPFPQLVLPLKENQAEDEFPLDRERPFVAQEQARRSILETLRDTHPYRTCWLVGPPNSGRYTLTAYLAAQSAVSETAEDQILLPPTSSSETLRWVALPAGEGQRLARLAEQGLRDWQSDLLNADTSIKTALSRLAASWEELSAHSNQHIRAYSENAQKRLAERAAYLRLRLSCGHSSALDDLDISLHRLLWGLLTLPDQSSPVLTAGSTTAELFGRFAERRCGSEICCDHTTYSGGALLQARGGALIIDGRGLVQDQALWQRLRLTLRRGYIELRDLLTDNSPFCPPSWNVRLPLSAAVFIAVSQEDFLQMAENDEDLGSALAHKAEFAEADWLTETHKRELAAWMVKKAQDCGGPGMAIDAIAAAVYYCSQKAAHAQRFYLQLGELTSVIRAASKAAAQRRAALIRDRDIEDALRQRRQSSAWFEEELGFYTDSDIIHVETDGKAVGQVNGLTVVELPEYCFGRPQRISAVVYASKDGLVDIERECQNGGKIHSKGTLILNGYILGCLGGLHTWPIGVSVCMEQSYESIDGDSASCAEACAVLSALADVPIDQGIAVTGSIDQFGNVQAVGGIAEKVQGFYKLCARRGLTGKQGVIIPRANLSEVLFDRELREAIQRERFHIWAVTHVSEAIEILTGLPMGRLRDDRYPKRSIMGKIQIAADEADR